MNKNIIAVLMVMSVVSVFLIGSSITGFVVFDDTVKPVCSEQSDCESPEVCCLFFEETGGVCSKESMCGVVTELTKAEKEDKTELMQLLYGDNQVLQLTVGRGYEYEASFMYGSIILLLTFLVLVLYIRYHHVSEPALKKVSKRKK